MLKIAAIGDRESVSGLKAVGIEVFSPENKEDCPRLLKSLCESEYAIIYITEEFGESSKDIIRKYEDKICPSIILIPGVKNNTGEGMKSVSRSIEKAVGSQLPD